MAKNKKTFYGRCMWPRCPEPGVFYTGRRIGVENKWGYACEIHERLIAKENFQRYQEDALYANARTGRTPSPSYLTAF